MNVLFDNWSNHHHVAPIEIIDEDAELLSADELIEELKQLSMYKVQAWI